MNALARAGSRSTADLGGAEQDAGVGWQLADKFLRASRTSAIADSAINELRHGPL